MFGSVWRYLVQNNKNVRFDLFQLNTVLFGRVFEYIKYKCIGPLSSCRLRIAPSIKKGRGRPYLFLKGVLSSLMCVLLLPPIPEGVIEIKPCGDTREK